MRKLAVFNSITLDGYFTGVNGDMSWAHKSDPEWNAFVQGNAKGASEMLFGRVTYDMMAGWWPTPRVIEMAPAVAQAMNSAPKVVFSRTLDQASWNNTRLVKSDIAEAVRKLKAEPGPEMVIMGSGTIVSQLAEAGLIDEFQVVVNPIVLGEGKSMFEGVRKKLALKRTQARTFENGCVVLWYEPGT
jgi:dihydrofolate reductase